MTASNALIPNRFGFATFLPIYLFTLPELGLYVPLHGPLLIFYFLLNHYLHCGYVIPAIEKILHPCYIMTSQWHNVHHEKGRMYRTVLCNQASLCIGLGALWL